MPNYDYECQSCDKIYEIFQSMKDTPLAACPECKAEAPAFYRKIGTGAGIVFKGTGFYETDYKRANKPNAEGASSGSEKKVESAGSCGKPACCAE